jgi:glycosyltransferase involved in cell wall biosynthesis
MYKGKSIAVVVPAYNEERFIAKVINTMPGFVDRVYVVDDASTDSTHELVSQIIERRSRSEQGQTISLISHSQNGGVGAAILTGHEAALKDNIDVIAVMAGDGQMDPAILHQILDPVVEGRAEYAKGNRLSPGYNKEMSSWRRFGNFLLTVLNRIASGYWHISDPQNGYTAISADILRKLNFDSIYRGFAFENDMLVKLHVTGARVVDIYHPAVYRGQQSKIRYHSFIVKTSWLLLKDFLWRLWLEHIKRPFGKTNAG